MILLMLGLMMLSVFLGKSEWSGRCMLLVLLIACELFLVGSVVVAVAVLLLMHASLSKSVYTEGEVLMLAHSLLFPFPLSLSLATVVPSASWPFP